MLLTGPGVSSVLQGEVQTSVAHHLPEHSFLPEQLDSALVAIYILEFPLLLPWESLPAPVSSAAL